MRGDVPIPCLCCYGNMAFSPHAWGCTAYQGTHSPAYRVFPTCVGKTRYADLQDPSHRHVHSHDILDTRSQDILYTLKYKFPPGKEGAMPWKEVGVKDQRISFVARAWEGKESMGDLCQEYGISRPTGYLWVKRFREAGSFQALEERLRRPHLEGWTVLLVTGWSAACVS